jgi:hypothetical protein
MDDRVGSSINEIIDRRSGTMEVLLTQDKTMFVDDIAEVWKLLRKHRFCAHEDHRTFYAQTNINIGIKWSVSPNPQPKNQNDLDWDWEFNNCD